MGTSKDLPEKLFHLLRDGQDFRSHCYRGRFAPSPTGPLHLGNLRTALVSWLRARFYKGEWLLRIDDLDTPRNRQGAIESIQRDLLWLGLDWDGPLVLQSQRRDLYRSVISSFKLQDKIYPCRCTRQQLEERARIKKDCFTYPGTCRDLKLPWGINQGRFPSLRLRVAKRFSITCGDVVLRRSDGFIAYHLATVVDEVCLGISEVVRGQDLAQVMDCHLAVIEALGQKTLSFRHVPLFFKKDGTKLSKRDGAAGLQHFQSIGMKAPNVIGLLASSLGIVPEGAVLSASELLSHLRADGNLFHRTFCD